jgi:hypothetical protein
MVDTVVYEGGSEAFLSVRFPIMGVEKSFGYKIVISNMALVMACDFGAGETAALARLHKT